MFCIYVCFVAESGGQFIEPSLFVWQAWGDGGEQGKSFCLFQNMNFSASYICNRILCHIKCSFCRRCLLYITRKPNYLYGSAIRMDVRRLWQGNKKRRTLLFWEGPRGGRGVPSRGGRGDIVTSTQDKEKYHSVFKVPSKQTIVCQQMSIPKKPYNIIQTHQKSKRRKGCSQEESHLNTR